EFSVSHQRRSETASKREGSHSVMQFRISQPVLHAMAEMRRVIITRFVFAMLLLASAAADHSFSASRSGLTRFEFAQAHMGTQFRIVLYAQDAEAAHRASTAAFDRIARLDATMSDYRETSELMMACKQAAHQWVKVSDDLFRELALSQ